MNKDKKLYLLTFYTDDDIFISKTNNDFRFRIYNDETIAINSMLNDIKRLFLYISSYSEGVKNIDLEKIDLTVEEDILNAFADIEEISEVSSTFQKDNIIVEPDFNIETDRGYYSWHIHTTYLNDELM